MTSRFLYVILACALYFCLCLVSSGCNEIGISSAWRTQTIVIDGNDGEWRSAPIHVRHYNMDIRAANDSTNLYLCLTTIEPDVAREILGNGFIIWFDSTGSGARTFGVKFPLGSRRDEADRIEPGMTNDERQRAYTQSFGELEILGPGKDDRMRLSTLTKNGFSLHLGREGERFIYEIQMQLHRTPTTPYAVGASPGKTVSIGFEAVERSLRDVRRAQQEEPTGSSTGGGRSSRGSRGQSGGGTAPPSDLVRPDRLQIWSLVTLASGDTGTVQR